MPKILEEIMNHFYKSVINNTPKVEIGIWITFLLTSAMILSCDSIKRAKPNHPLVYLNHVYVTVDSSTYSDICNSDFIKNRFAYIKTKTIKADNNDSWTGTYIDGQNTYIEIFNSGNEINRGHSGIAFGTEICGGADSLYKSLTDSGKKHIKKYLRHLRTETGEIPWFYKLYSTKEDSNSILSTWVMEYLVEYMKYKFPDIDPQEINITRELYNHKKYQEDLLLKDIIEVEIALDEFDYKKLHQELIFYGYEIERMGLNDNQNKDKTINFGTKARLILNTDKTAEWHFNM
jgi:hypothetical protein